MQVELLGHPNVVELTTSSTAASNEVLIMSIRCKQDACLANIIVRDHHSSFFTCKLEMASRHLSSLFWV